MQESTAYFFCIQRKKILSLQLWYDDRLETWWNALYALKVLVYKAKSHYVSPSENSDDR